MARWLTAEQLSQELVAGENRLRNYSRRGDLPRRELPSGTVLYDATHAATLFPPRGAKMVQASGHFGVLGKARLGELHGVDRSERVGRRAPAQKLEVNAA